LDWPEFPTALQAVVEAEKSSMRVECILFHILLLRKIMENIELFFSSIELSLRNATLESKNRSEQPANYSLNPPHPLSPPTGEANQPDIAV
jgi:hypothetical protein